MHISSYVYYLKGLTESVFPDTFCLRTVTKPVFQSCVYFFVYMHYVCIHVSVYIYIY
jgi:hypothetical protein